MRTTMTALVSALALFGLTAAQADEQYDGILQDNERNVPVALTLDPSVQLGTAAGRIRFNGDWRCGFTLEYAGKEGPADSYSLQGAGAGRCTSLTSGYLHVLPGTGGVQVQILDKLNQPAHSVSLGSVGA